MNVEDYLKRIGFTTKPAATLGNLYSLQRAHLYHIPFENLDIHWGNKIDLAHTYQKVVQNGRGGFCYELNGLFYELLIALGYTVKRISARVFDAEKGYGPEFDHMALIAHLEEGDFLVDVGFGEFAISPLRIVLDRMQHDDRGLFKITRLDDNRLLVSKQAGNIFIPEYSFTEQAHALGDFEPMCIYHQTSEDSHFTKKKVCTIATPNGRITLSTTSLKIRGNDVTTEMPITDEKSFNSTLWKHFSIQR